MCERAAQPTAAQMEALVEYLEVNPSLAKGQSKTHRARERVRLQWEQLALHLNSMGGTIKSAKQWTKYWSDKKSATKKKAAARAAARSRTGGGVDDDIELSEVEERIISLLGGDGSYTGDAHYGIQSFRDSMIPQQRSPESQEVLVAVIMEPDQSDDESKESQGLLSGRLLGVDEDTEISQSPELNVMPFARQKHLASSLNTSQPNRPVLSPPPTHSRTTTPLSIPRSAARFRMGPPPSVASRFRNGATSQMRRTLSSRGRVLRGADSTSRHTTIPTSPFSQTRREFSRITERFLRVEEQQLELQRSNSRMMERILQQNAEREKLLVEAVTTLGDRILDQMASNDHLLADAVGEGLKALAEAFKRDK